MSAPSAPRQRPAAKRASTAERRVESASLMLQRLTAGSTMSDLSKTTGLSERTVRRRIAAARDGNDLLEGIRTVLVQDMLPRSLAVMQEALDGDDMKLAVTVAMKIVDTLGMRAIGHPVAEGPPNAGRTEDSLELWRERLTLTRRVDEPAAVEALPPEVSGVPIEGVLLPPAPVDVSGLEAAEPASDSADARSGSSQECLPFGSQEPDA